MVCARKMVIFLITIGIFFVVSRKMISVFRDDEQLAVRSIPLQTVEIGDKRYRLEIAKTDDERQIGLSNRSSLCETCAMAFVFDSPGRYGFWMKDMRFPLDIVWLIGGRAVHIERRVPADSQAVFIPDQQADLVLELNAGSLDGFSVDSFVRFR